MNTCASVLFSIQIILLTYFAVQAWFRPEQYVHNVMQARNFRKISEGAHLKFGRFGIPALIVLLLGLLIVNILFRPI